MQAEYSRITSLLQLVAEEGIATLEFESSQFSIRIQRQSTEPSAMPLPVLPAQAHEVTSVALPGVTQVCAPVDGLFYRAASEGGTPLCEVGTVVMRGAPLCIIEAMKIMNQIEADCAGCVTDVLVADGNMVRQGQPLFNITRG
jgi:acetyl-CoA carboxylase biotin carboxyl carrier protein